MITYLFVHRDALLRYKRYKIYKILFQWPSKVHKYQCTQNTYCFCIFLIFDFFLMKSKIKQNWKQTNKNMLNKAKHKTRLTQNKKAKHTSNAYSKTRKGEREKLTKLLRAFFLPHLGRTFLFDESLIWWWGGRIEAIQVRKEHEGFE